MARRVSARFSAPFALLTDDPTRGPLDASLSVRRRVMPARLRLAFEV